MAHVYTIYHYSYAMALVAPATAEVPAARRREHAYMAATAPLPYRAFPLGPLRRHHWQSRAGMSTESKPLDAVAWHVTVARL